jgi:hypothetical protein
MPYYAFYDHNIDFYKIMFINIDDDGIVGELLDEYRESDEEYNFDGWFEFLKSKGYDAHIAEPECQFYF